MDPEVKAHLLVRQEHVSTPAHLILPSAIPVGHNSGRRGDDQPARHERKGPQGGARDMHDHCMAMQKFYGGAFERPEPQSRMSMPLSVYRRLHFTRFSTTAPERDRLWQQDPLLENLVKCSLRWVSTFYIFRDAREALRRVVTALFLHLPSAFSEHPRDDEQHTHCSSPRPSS
jgi:hypothetical protein